MLLTYQFMSKLFLSNIKIFSYALFILVFSYSIKSDTTLNTFNSNNITYECIALSFEEDWKCIEQKSKQSISFSSISKKLPANILTKIKFEEPNGMMPGEESADIVLHVEGGR